MTNEMLPNYIKTGTLVNKKFHEFLVPTLLMSMSAQLGVVLDGILVGRMIGPDAMASVGACMPVTQAASALAVLISVGAVRQITVASGLGNRDEANRIFSTALMLSLVAGGVLSLLFFLFSQELARFIAPTQELTTSCAAYLGILIWRFPISISLVLMCDLVRSDGMAKLSSKAVMVQQSVNLLMDLLLMGALGLGLHGAALATVLGDIAGIGLIWGIYYPAKERTLRFFRRIGSSEFGTKSLALIHAGLPAALGMGLVAVKVWFLYRIVAWAGGTAGVTIYAACMYYLIFLSMFSNGINQSLLPVLSVLYGEKDYRSVRMLMRYVCRFTMYIVGISVIIAFLFPQELLRICKLPADLAAQGANDVRLFSLSFFGEAWSFLMIYYYSAVGQNTVGKLLSMTTGFFAVLPAAWIFSTLWGRTGVWLGLIFAGIAGAAVVMIYSRYICARSEGKLSDFYLIETNGSELLYDVSLKAKKEDAVSLSKDTIAALERQDLTRGIAMKAGIALEEITAHLASLNEKAVDFDVRILNQEENILLALRDNGKAFNPMEYQPPENDPYWKADGIVVLKALAEDIHYDRVLALNQTVVTIRGTAIKDPGGMR